MEILNNHLIYYFEMYKNQIRIFLNELLFDFLSFLMNFFLMFLVLIIILSYHHLFDFFLFVVYLNMVQQKDINLGIKESHSLLSLLQNTKEGRAVKDIAVMKVDKFLLMSI